MPFQSEAQRRYLWAKHPDIAERWAKEYPNQKRLPKHKHKRKTKRGQKRKTKRSTRR